MARFSVIEDTNEGIGWVPARDTPRDYVFVTYSHTTLVHPVEAAFYLAREQSVSTYGRLHGETLDLRERRSAKVVEARPDTIVLAYPVENFRQIGELLVTINGNGNFLSIFSRLVVEQIECPASFLGQFAGPAYGARLLTTFDLSRRPVLLGVQKPSIGLSPTEHGARTSDAYLGGCDIVKDDEQLYADDPASPLGERIKVVGAAIGQVRDLTGRGAMYVFNLENEREMLEHCDLLEAQCRHDDIPRFAILLSLMLGVPFIAFVRRHTRLPIFVHGSGFGIYTRGPFGFSPPALAKILRLAGADCLIAPGPYSRVVECSPESALRLKAVCDAPLGHALPMVLALGGGMRRENYWAVRDLMGTNAFIFVVGGGVFGHPDGPRAGAAALANFMECAAADRPGAEAGHLAGRANR